MKKKAWSRTAVSDIIANLLILAITVTLFSSIIWFVSSMPAPQPNSYGDFSAKVNYRSGEYVNITIKHMGGEPLDNSKTNILIITDAGQISAKISDSRPSIGFFWNLGTTWSYNTTDPLITNLDVSSKLEVMIIDTERNMVVWDGMLLDNKSNSVPVILDRYLATHVDGYIWLRSSTFRANDSAALFVNVYDGGNDLKYVYADASSLNPALTNISLLDTNADSWFSTNFLITTTTPGLKVIHITAVDNGERVREVDLMVNLLSDGTGGSGGDGSHGTGLFPANFLINQLQGMNIFRMSDWQKYNYSAIATRHYNHTEQAVVVVASKFLVNLENENTLYIIDPATSGVISTVSSPAYVFSHYDFYSGYYIYEAIVDIPKMTDNKTYLVQVQLRDSWLPNNNVFFAADTIYVGEVSQPTITTYSDPNYTVHATNFTTSDTIYVKMTNFNGGTWVQNGGLVQIADYSWNMQIKRIPGSQPEPNPVSNVTNVAGNEYRFSIDLNYSSQDPWNPGTASYMLRYDMFQAGTEKYLLATMVNITSPKIKLDLAEGQSGPSVGWASGSLINFYKNNNQWVPPDFITNYPGKHTDAFEACNFVRLGDINNNGRNDVIAVLDGFHIIQYSNNGAWTPSAIYDEASDSRGTVKAIELGYINADHLLDIIVAYSDGSVGYYRNDGVWTYVQVAGKSTQVPTTIQAIDVNKSEASQGAPSAESIVAGYASGGAKIFTNLDGIGTSWSSTTLPGGTPAYTPYSATSEQSINSIMAVGKYTNTVWNGSGYEQLNEVGLNVTSVAHANSPTNVTGYSIYPGGDLNVTGWNTWNPIGQTPTMPFLKVETKMSYTVPANSGASDILMNGTKIMTIPANNNADPYTGTLTYDLTGTVANYSDLAYLTFYLKNTAGSGNYITLNYWDLEINYTSNNYVLDHIYTFTGLPQAVMNTFDIYANTSNAANHDTFTVQYQLNGGPWTPLANIVIDSPTIPIQPYSGVIGATPAGTSTISIKISDVNRTSTSRDIIQIKSMAVTSTSILSNPIGQVTSIKIADMDQDTWPDIVISDKTGIWVYWNTNGYVAPSIFKSISTGLSTILTIGPGTFHGKTGLMDIAVGTSTGLYLITQTSLDTYSAPALIANKAINNGECMAVGDVFGNGYYSVIIASDKTLILYINRGTNFSPQTIDVIDGGTNNKVRINTLYVGMLRNG